jgi:hypothetical protein
MNITADYADVINKEDMTLVIKRRKELLTIQRPLTIDENKELDKLSYVLLLQKEITEQKRKRKNFIKLNSNKGSVVV